MDAFQKLGIDLWGMLFYLVNFGVLFVLLKRFLYKPLLKFLDSRRETIQGNIEEAEGLRREFEAERSTRDKEYREKLAALDTRVAEARMLVKEQAEQIMAEAVVRRDAMLREAEEQIERKKTQIEQELTSEILARIEKVVLTVVARESSEKDVRASVLSAWSEVDTSKTS